MPRTLDIAVIVSTFERPYHLRRCLLSLGAQRDVDGRFEVVVVDDGSRDNTAEVVARTRREVNFPLSFVSHPHDGYHLARCRNAGLRSSTAPYVLFTDGDCIFPFDHLSGHLAARKAGVARAGDCHRIEEVESNQIDERAVVSGAFDARFSSAAQRGMRKAYRKALLYQLLRNKRRPKLVGWNIAAWRSDLERVNGFDERFRGWGCEDDDLAARLRAAGVRIRSALRFTHGYHLWHPLHATTPARWQDGLNVQYLNRPLRLTRCLKGIESRQFEDLSVRPIAGDAHALVAHEVRQAFSNKPGALEIELLFWPVQADFSRYAEHRILVAAEPEKVPKAVRRKADATIQLAERPTLAQIRRRLRELVIGKPTATPAVEGIAAAA